MKKEYCWEVKVLHSRFGQIQNIIEKTLIMSIKILELKEEMGV